MPGRKGQIAANPHGPVGSTASLRRMKDRRVWQYVGLGVLAAVAVALSTLAASGFTLAPAQSYVSQPQPAETPREKIPVAAFIGDSFTAGSGGVRPLWPEIVSKAQGWKMVNLAYGGTGFLTSVPASGEIPYHPTYLEVAQTKIADLAPDVIVVSTAGNDGDKDVRAAAENLFTLLRREAPDAQILVLSPFGRAQKMAQFATLADQVKAAAAAVGVEYVKIGDPLLGHPELFLDDRVHPTAAGHAALAKAILAAIRA